MAKHEETSLINLCKISPALNINPQGFGVIAGLDLPTGMHGEQRRRSDPSAKQLP